MKSDATPRPGPHDGAARRACACAARRLARACREYGCLLSVLFPPAIVAAGDLPEYRVALPGYAYEFPRDHFSHPDFQTEWWYYTGNLFTAEGRRFGFELTFFRQALGRDGDVSPWNLDDLYFAHLALSDIGAGEFHHSERFNRAGPGLAGASLEQLRVWNGNWQVRWQVDGKHLTAVTERYRLELVLTPRKPPVIHGRGGVSQKAEGKGRASHYVSFTRLEARGRLLLDGVNHEVAGQSWMDHEFFTHQLDAGQTGWDWMSIQFEDGTELMIFQLRRAGDGVDPHSAGTYVAPDGRTRHLTSDEFRLEPGSRRWKRYPIDWTIHVAPLRLKLRATTPLNQQELTGKRGVPPSYWEGTMDFTGERDGRPVRGVGYLEMTGYEAPVRLGADTP